MFFFVFFTPHWSHPQSQQVAKKSLRLISSAALKPHYIVNCVVRSRSWRLWIVWCGYGVEAACSLGQSNEPTRVVGNSKRWSLFALMLTSVLCVSRFRWVHWQRRCSCSNNWDLELYSSVLKTAQNVSTARTVRWYFAIVLFNRELFFSNLSSLFNIYHQRWCLFIAIECYEDVSTLVVSTHHCVRVLLTAKFKFYFSYNSFCCDLFIRLFKFLANSHFLLFGVLWKCQEIAIAVIT